MPISHQTLAPKKPCFILIFLLFTLFFPSLIFNLQHIEHIIGDAVGSGISLHIGPDPPDRREGWGIHTSTAQEQRWVLRGPDRA